MGRIKNRWPYKVIATVVVVGALPIMALGILNPGNVAQTSPHHPDSSLRTRPYTASLFTVRQTVRRLVPTLSTYGRAWRLIEPMDEMIPLGLALHKGGVNAGIEGQRLTINAEVPVVVFTDDLQVTLRAETNATVVDVRSASRVGKGDFGENARHIRQLLSALDKKFKPLSQGAKL